MKTNEKTKRNSSADLTDSVADQQKLRPDTAVINLPDVEDIPGQEYIKPPTVESYVDATISSAREEKSQFAPRIHTIQIPTDKIRDLIGPGGKVIRGIVDATGVKIDVDDSGRVNVASSDADGLARAIQMISDITAVPEIGKIYLGKVVRLAEFGAFVEIFPGTDGLLHISEIADRRVKDVRDELKEGQQILVKCSQLQGSEPDIFDGTNSIADPAEVPDLYSFVHQQ